MSLVKHLLAIPMALAATGAATVERSCAQRVQPTDHASHDHRAHKAEMQRASPERQAEIARRSGPVMGFDLDRTLHTFAPKRDGGVLTVTSRDGDARQVESVRGHLEYQAKAFSGGDWANPVQIHGADMPGLAELMAARGKLTVTYRPIARGGKITFVTANTKINAALHQWFEAQNSDHGKHAGH